ncbi:DUF2510 domain-containing protein [Actinomadura opuntiae]|uniref:DUF2510 domain-containing protein n=1 Tax=Actinomadura sp. OS1-43 TaxID=604315 RepID=UPI00255A909B|nr:DUF2510 domain-containing protein [Actinomadura sp. OS1-43]MDL4814893.1 DUF2510 domain-containing protein [Actinomadura sp. OS1-43]
MTQAGWYADPYGGGGHRWWDGTKWTEHVNATPAQQPAAPQPQYGVGQAPQYGGPVLHKKRYGVELHADAHSITWARTTIELAKAEYVGYTAVQTRMRGPLNIGSVHTSTDYHFEIGFFPVNEAPGLAFEETGLRANKPPSDWQFLVDLSRTYVEPRLLRQYLAAIEAGQTVEVGKIRINRNGFVGGSVSRGWEGIEGITFDKGWYFVHARGADKPILKIPQQNQNVMLLPQIFDTLKR